MHANRTENVIYRLNSTRNEDLDLLPCSCLATGMWSFRVTAASLLEAFTSTASKLLAPNACFCIWSNLNKSFFLQRDTSTRSIAKRPVRFRRGNPGPAARSPSQPGHDWEDSYRRSSMAGWGSLNTTDGEPRCVNQESYSKNSALGRIQRYSVCFRRHQFCFGQL